MRTISQRARRSIRITRSNFCAKASGAKWSGVNFNYKVRALICTFILMENRRMLPCDSAAPIEHFPTRRLPISHHFHGNTRDAEGFCTLLFTWAVVRMCFSPRFTSRVGCSPMETSVTHYPRNAREKLLRSFSPPPFQRFKKLRVL